MRSNLVSFASNNPDTTIVTEIKRNRHPVFCGNYANGNSKTVCIKNLPINGVNDFALFIRNQIGYKVNYSAAQSKLCVLMYVYRLMVNIRRMSCILISQPYKESGMNEWI